jgi:hypothetical protein
LLSEYFISVSLRSQTAGELSMANTFPWPVTDDELLLTNALADVMQACQADEEAAANLIIEAYNQGVREQTVLVHYALEKLQGRAGA